jgi:hypothetical protein
MASSDKITFITDIYIDIASVGDKKLAVYPNFLCLGKPIFDTHLQRVKFLSDTTIQITERSFEYFLVFLPKAFKIFDHLKTEWKLIYTEQVIEKNSNLEEAKNCLCYYGSGEKDQRTVTITSSYPLKKLSFNLNSIEFQELCQAFSNLFFKSYCYPPMQNTIIDDFVLTSTLKDIQELTLKDLLLHFKSNSVIDINPNEALIIANLIVRHRKILCLWHRIIVFDNRYQIPQKEALNLECKFHVSR